MNVAAEAVLLLVAATLCATAALDHRAFRTATQGVLVATTAFMLWAGGAPMADLTLAVALLLVVGGLATNLASGFRRAREEERSAREAAERRTELLEAVRALPELDVRAAAQVATAALRTLGAKAAGVVFVRDGRVVPVDLNGVPPIDRLLRVGEGVAGRTIAEGRTLVVADYQELPERFDHLQDLRSSVGTPIRVGDEVVGAIMASQEEPGQPTAGEIEVLEILAAHLGVVLATRRQLDNQRMLLRRMDRLEAMRSTFVDEVSDELRDPLTVIRGAGEAMRRHGEALPAEDRHRLLQRLCGQADDLRRIVDALLDFSRVQAGHRATEIGQVSLRQLFSTFGRRLAFDASAPLHVEVTVDVPLLRYAVELLLDGRNARVHVRLSEGSVRIDLHGEGQDRPALVRSLVSQIAVNAGATLDFDEVPRLVLPRPDVAAREGAEVEQ